MAKTASSSRKPRPALGALVAASLVANGAAAPLAYASAPTPEIRVASGAGFSRLDLRGATAIRRDGSAAVIRFDSAPNLARLHVDPPQFLKDVAIKPVAGGAEVRVTPADGAELSIGQADGASFINLRAQPAAPSPAVPAAASKPDAAPVEGVTMSAAFKAGVLSLRFPWTSPVGAAVFRRGDTVWVVFDAKARLNLGSAPRGLAQAKRFDPVEGPNYTAVRIASPASAAVSATADGSAWVVSLGATAAHPPPISVAREEDGSAALSAQTPGATGVIWLTDPAVGDRLAVVTATRSAGAPTDRAFVDAQVLASAQGLVLRSASDDLAVALDGERVRIGRPRGLALSQPGAAAAPSAPQAGALELPKPANLPGLIDFAGWSQTGEGGFLKRYDALLTAAADETARGKAAGVEARMGLARFLVGSELAEEAIGVLDTLAKVQPAVTATAEFRGLRGAARVMARRYKDAEADYSAPAIADDPAAALWRGYAQAKQGDAASAAGQFALGRAVLEQAGPVWRARFAAAAAGAALQLNNADDARRFLAGAGEARTPEDLAEQTLMRARLAEIDGKPDVALGLYDGLSADRYGAVAAPALLKATELKLAAGKLPVNDAVAALDSIRFRWRGDATELEVVRELGQVNLRQGRYREALEAWRSAGSRMPDLPAAAAIRTDLSQAFKDLFLGGRADGLEPVQALALFYDFRDYTPIGADGDLMVRRLVRRLVDVDLLDQAADLLKYQVDNRLDGAAKAQVATDLALVYLMNRKPEDALGAINGSRSTLLPNALNLQRRVLEARALIDLHRTDHALEVLGTDPSPEATELRALAAWRGRDWPAAAKLSEARLGERWKRPDPLTPAEASMLVRAGVAMSLASDEAGLARLRQHYASLTDTAPNPEALRVALAGLNTAAGPALLNAISDGDAFGGWVARMKARFRDPASPAAPAAAPRRTAQAQAPSPARG